MNIVYNLEYNTEREKLIIPEYGRHFQKMVDHAVSVEDKDERIKLANAIVSVMGNLQPHLRDVPEFNHKLWDQLFIMSDFKLDVPSPFPITSKELLEQKPDPLNYPQNFPKYRFYGNNIKRMIDVAISWEKGEKRSGLEHTIANHMKKCFLNWNKDTVEDAVIYKHLTELSQGEINLETSGEALTDSDTFLKNMIVKHTPTNNRNKNNNKQRNNNRQKKRY
ncbi:MAG: DUF4290 domain-containing protein [Flavobacteriia bacterium]|nr:DUF4290 domain-containing protein [Flavobacteriia bacterium]